MSHSTTPSSSNARLWLDGEPVHASEGCSLAAFLLQHRPGGWRRSIGGEVRAPLCGMGICFECRVQVDGQSRLACMTPCQDGMTVQTEGRPAEGCPAEGCPAEGRPAEGCPAEGRPARHPEDVP